MPAAPQSYANHVQRPVAWNIAWLLSLVAVPIMVVAAVSAPTLQNIGLVMMAMGLLVGVSLMRLFALRLQDRIIRLEMGVRLTRLGRAADLTRLMPRQLIALRFASDAEMSALIERAVAEQLKPDEIKRAIREWQPDQSRV